MALKTPEQALAEFEAILPRYLRLFLQEDKTFGLDEALQWAQADWDFNHQMQHRYEALLRRIPTKWRAYTKRQQKLFTSVHPASKIGRPRKDQEREDARLLRQQGLSYAQIALKLRATPENLAREKERIRKLISSLKPTDPGEKSD